MIMPNFFIQRNIRPSVPSTTGANGQGKAVVEMPKVERVQKTNGSVQAATRG